MTGKELLILLSNLPEERLLLPLYVVDDEDCVGELTQDDLFVEIEDGVVNSLVETPDV